MPGARPDENFLDFVPVRVVDAEPDGDGRVALLRPKFARGLLARWIQPRLAHPYYRVHLDEIGSAVWELIDGCRSAGDIAATLGARFGPRCEPSYERVAMFLRELERGEMIRLVRPPGGCPGAPNPPPTRDSRADPAASDSSPSPTW